MKPGTAFGLALTAYFLWNSFEVRKKATLSEALALHAAGAPLTEKQRDLLRRHLGRPIE